MSACRFEDRVSRCDVPIPGRRQPRIKVGRTFGEAAEFHRRAAWYELGLRETVDIGAGARLQMRAAYHDDDFTLGARPRVNEARRRIFAIGKRNPLRAAANDAAPR